MPTVTLYNGTDGLNTEVDPKSLSQGGKNNPGIIELAQAVNISIDDRGLATLRQGDTEVVAGAFHSLFCDGGNCFVVKDGATSATLNRVNADLSLSVVRSGLSTGLRCEFAQTNTDTFYTNGVQHGFIRAGVNAAWPVNTYRGPDADIEFATSVPVANHLAFMQGGRCAISVGQSVFLNHEPFKYGLFAPALGFIGFESDVLMLCPVQAGFFVSDQRQTWFFRKVDGGWYHYKQELADAAPAIEWSLAAERVLLRDVGIDMPGFGRVWVSQEGICLGTDDGTVINLTKEKVKYPAGYARGACLVKGTTVIHTVW